MKYINIGIIVFCFLLTNYSIGLSKERNISPRQSNSVNIPRPVKGAAALPSSFRVKSTTFKKVNINNDMRLVAAVVFNKNIDASSVIENVNIRLLKKNNNHFWVDVEKHNNIVRIRPNFITWVCGASLSDGIYVMHLRGTIKSSDGLYLDCDGDGKGEGGNLPAYESALFQVNVNRLIEIDPGRLDGLLRDR
ncbi:MAG: hypothetical protein GY699_22925 [Desulfobacteraceae bacterium]|nr:hypothetical protein [Desulfobacteraceae bacterium]